MKKEERVSWICPAEVFRARCMVGNAGRYMSIDKGAKAVMAPRMMISSTLLRPGVLADDLWEEDKRRGAPDRHKVSQTYLKRLWRGCSNCSGQTCGHKNSCLKPR